MTTRVMVVDDHPMWRDAVARGLSDHGYQVVAVASDGESAVRIAKAVNPHVVLMDLQLPDISGVIATGRLLADNPKVRVLVLSASAEDVDVLSAVKTGAAGYLMKSASQAELLDAVQRVHRGEVIFSPGLAGLVLGEFRRMSTQGTVEETPRLTARETEVLRLIAKGLTAKQIAERLVLSHRTVQNHVQNTLTKLQLNNRVELVRYAIEQGLDDTAG